jgi:hypothetical protein
VTEERSEYLTESQRATLEAELAELEGPRRAQVVQAIRTAREHGDLSENFEYQAAKNEQGWSKRGFGLPELGDPLAHVPAAPAADEESVLGGDEGAEAVPFHFVAVVAARERVRAREHRLGQHEPTLQRSSWGA